jgi:hypothetical protein
MKSTPGTNIRMAMLVALTTVAGTACDDDPFGLDDWTANPTQLLVYSLARPELNLPSGANLYQKFTLRLESPGSTGNWDIALDTRDGQLVFLGPNALGLDSRVRIATVPDSNFDDVRRAPSDSTAYVSDEPVPVALNTVYVVRTNLYPGPFGGQCSFYSKLEPLEVDEEQGTVIFVVDTNPLCNDLDLVPPNGD